MDFRLGETGEALCAEVRAFLAEEMTPELQERVYRTGVAHDDEFVAKMVQKGWFAAEWPVEDGGRSLGHLENMALVDEFLKVHAPVYLAETTKMAGRAIMRAGSQELRDRVSGPALRGELTIAIGYSEPGAGSDVAAVQTRAVRDGDEWVINGQKMFTTNGHIADYVFLLTSTNSDVPKHRGLTIFLVPLNIEGFDAQGVYTLSGERTNITFYNDVRVDDSWRVGDVDRGWDVMMLALQDEHGAGFGGPLSALVEDVEAWAKETEGDDGTLKIYDRDVRRRLARAATEVEVATLLSRRAAWMTDVGQVAMAEAPMSKLFSAEALERAAEDLSELIGADSLRGYFDPTAPQGGRIEHALRYSLGTTIYAGTSEIQRNIIAQWGLGLPR